MGNVDMLVEALGAGTNTHGISKYSGLLYSCVYNMAINSHTLIALLYSWSGAEINRKNYT